MKATRIHRTGGPEVLTYEECQDPEPGPGEVVVGLEAVGVNYTDVISRTGVTAPASFPAILGREGAGVVSAVGPGVTEYQAGDPVGYWGTTGTYAERQAVPADRLVRLTSGIDARTAAAVMLQGTTAHYLVYSMVPGLGEGDAAVVHAAAGGTGLVLTQMLKRVGVYVYATAGTEEKAAIAREAGADETVIYTREDFAQRVLESTGGKGVRAVFDSVGRATYEGSVACLARRGYLALYGRASGGVPAEVLADLKKSMFLSRPALMDYCATREELEWRASEVFGWVASGELKVRIGGTYPLSDAAEAHRRLEGRETTGKLLLIP